MAKEKTIICFDLDGTLIDSTETHVVAFNKAFEKNNLPTQPSKSIVAEFGRPAELIIKAFFPKIPDRKVLRVAKDKSEIILNETINFTKPIPKAKEALEELKQKYFIALVSNSAHEEIVALLKQGGIPPKIFNAIACKKEVAHSKPAPDEIFKIEKKIGTKVEYLVGDTTYDIIAGKAAGIKTIAVLTGVHNITKLGVENPTLIIESVAVLPDVLFGRL